MKILNFLVLPLTDKRFSGAGGCAVHADGVSGRDALVGAEGGGDDNGRRGHDARE
jgi:hypothetical protein